MNLLISPCPEPVLEAQAFEIVERKGTGHPDTICDALAEAFSAGLSQWYLDRFGFIAHHNVDKVLLRGGESAPAFGGGEILAPMEVFLAGRATATYRGVQIPIADIAETSCRRWLKENLHALDVDRHVSLRVVTHPGSPDLVDLFMRQREAGALLANDTSCGVGYWPLSPLERAVLEVERALNAPDVITNNPAFGEDVKVMGVRQCRSGSLTISRAMIARYLPGLDAYEAAVGSVHEIAARSMSRVADLKVNLAVNAADNPDNEEVFLTVTGTSAEGGDDGETGRGNRPNGLISTYRPMTMEAAAGKNPVTHVGKLYGIASTMIACRAVEEIDEIIGADCALVSQIGRPVTQPQLTSLRLRMLDDAPTEAVRPALDDIVRGELDALAAVHERILRGEVCVY